MDQIDVIVVILQVLEDFISDHNGPVPSACTTHRNARYGACRDANPFRADGNAGSRPGPTANGRGGGEE